MLSLREGYYTHLGMQNILRIAVLTTAFFMSFYRHAAAQQPRRDRCGTVQNMALLRSLDPTLESDAEFERRLAPAIAAERARLQNSAARTTDEVLRIPVVFHIIHQGQAIGTGDNLSEAQILSQIKVMNQDYRRMAGTRGYNTDARGADVRIEFVLAKRDRSDAAFNGIDRIDAHTLGLTTTPYEQTQLASTIKPRTIWDATRYMNLWVANIRDLYGIAQFPIMSAIGGLACTPTPSAANTDGVTIAPNACGSLDDGNFNVDAAAAYARTATHETGHFLGLRHIWGDGNCLSDYCEDTPRHSGQNRGCPTHPKQTCGTDEEMFENYMDYTNDQCVNIFTRDQMIRIRAVLKTCPRRRELLTSPALLEPTALDAGLAGIVSPLRDYCSGLSTATVLVKNYGTTALTAVSTSYQIGSGAIIAVPFTLSLAAGATDTLRFTGLNFPAGSSRVTFYLTGTNGQATTPDFLDTLSTVVQVGPGLAVPSVETFEGRSTPPLNWSMVNAGNDCRQWRMQSVPTGPLSQPTVAAMMNYFQASSGSTLQDALITPLMDLSGDTSAYLFFDLAHQRTSASSAGTLRVDISTDCGVSWQATPVYSQAGAALATVTNTSNTEFYPSAASQWRRETVNLHAFAGQTVRLRFVATNTGGTTLNTLFVDNVTLARALPQAPIVHRMDPDSGAIGSSFTVYGQHFTGASTVTVGSARIAPTAVLNDTSLTALVPNGATTGHVSVTNSVGTGTSAGNYTVISAPTIASFTPASGPVGTVVSVRGTGFDRVRRAYFNGTPVASLTHVSATQLTATVPVGATTGPISVATRTDSVTSASVFIVGNVLTVRNGVDTSCAATLTTPGYPGQYTDNLNITYKIYAERNRQVKLQFLTFDTEAGYDFVKVYDRASATGTPIWQGSGSTLPPLLQSTGRVLTISFTSDLSNTGTGFSAIVSCTPPPQPIITNMSPRQGPIGYTFGLQGTSLANVDTVWFGNIPVTSLVATASLVTGTVPAGAVTSYMRVRSPLGKDTSLQQYMVTEGQPHCRPIYTACNSSTGIRRVTMPGIGFAANTPCTDASGAAFTIYPMTDSATGVLPKGGVVQVNVWASAGEPIGAWLDVNRNQTYDASEYFAATSLPTATAPGVIYITLPGSSDTSLMSLRIRSRATLTADAACSSATSGSAADFTFRVRACAPVVLPTSLHSDSICAGDTARIFADGVGTDTWFASDSSRQVLFQGSPYFSTPNTSVDYYVAMSDNGCLSNRQAIHVQVSPIPEADFAATGNVLTASQGSQAPGNSYQWYLNGQPIAGATSATYTIDSSGLYSMQVLGSNGCDATSASRNVIYTGVHKSVVSQISVQPNPSQGIFYLSGAGKSVSAEVLDATGRPIWTGAISGAQRLDLSQAGRGLYILRAPGMAPVRLVVE